MTIEKGDFIKVTYTGKFDDDNIFDTTNEELAKESEIYNPRGVYGGDVIVVGAGHTIQGLDEDFIGKKVGYKGTIDIPPEKGFGAHDPKLVESLPVNRFEKKDVHPGANVEIEGKRGVVVKVIGRRARVDFNHPLAGKTINYEYTIDSKLEDDAAKINGLLTLYTGIPEVEATIKGKTAVIEVPLGLTFNQRWLMAKGQIASQILDSIGMDKVQYVETYPSEPIAPAVEEVETEEVESSEE